MSAWRDIPVRIRTEDDGDARPIGVADCDGLQEVIDTISGWGTNPDGLVPVGQFDIETGCFEVVLVSPDPD